MLIHSFIHWCCYCATSYSLYVHIHCYSLWYCAIWGLLPDTSLVLYKCYYTDLLMYILILLLYYIYVNTLIYTLVLLLCYFIHLCCATWGLYTDTAIVLLSTIYALIQCFIICLVLCVCFYTLILLLYC